MKKFLTSTLLLFLITSTSYGLTLQEAVKTALKENNYLKAQEISVKEKEINLKISKARLLPSFSLYTDYNKTTDPPYAIMNRMEVQKLDMFNTNFNDPGKSQLFRTGINAFLPIWLGGKLRIGIDISKKDLKAEKTKLSKSKQEIIYQVVKAYYQVLTAKSYVETAKLAVRDAQKHVKDAETAYKAGLTVKSDVLRAKVYLEQAEENLVKAKSNYEIAKRALLTAMGLMPLNSINIDGELTYKKFNFNLQKLIKTALKNRPELKELSIREKQSNDVEKLAKSDFLPSIVAYGDYFMASDAEPLDKDNSSWTFGLKASVKLFDGGIRFREVEKARLMKLKIKENRERAEKGIAFEVSRAYYNFLQAEKRVELSAAAIKSAEESLRIMEKRYKNGLATITELLDTQTALNQARSNYVAALSAYRMAVADVYYTTGTIDKHYSELAE
ncbi:Outer membrane protein TolC [Desulfurobacterium pacificum]|uniref:Outer membrane protein TolC n=1 Tax=Desulfurobacterium pacificum TaxID=240166 RepID=A0ABY1NF87_9BACT|nr:TolC family protein [Desulfurobacterium pacificum]SMP08154.1 Outer membrane protein TolC [Desulfurobacterium pacificum]